MIGYWLSANQWNHRKICDRQTDKQTDRHIHKSVYRVAPQLKKNMQLFFFASNIFLTQNYFDANIFGPKYFWVQKFFGPTFFEPKFLWIRNIFYLKLIATQNFVLRKYLTCPICIILFNSKITSTIFFDTIEINLGIGFFYGVRHYVTEA